MTAERLTREATEVTEQHRERRRWEGKNTACCEFLFFVPSCLLCSVPSVASVASVAKTIILALERIIV
jgi:hypothetical protein